MNWKICDMIIILGGGLTGLSVGYHLAKEKVEFKIIEKDKRVGGLCKTENIDGFLFDYTGHFLHFKTDYAERLVKKLLGKNLEKHQRNSWIYSKNVFTPYPFQKNTHGLPFYVKAECFLGLIKTRFKRSKLKTFEEWILNSFGNGIAKHFMIPYNEKLWTLHPKYLTTEWVGSFVPKVSVLEFIKGALFSVKRDTVGYNPLFYYPKKGGIESLPRAFERQIKKYIIKNTKIKRIDIKNKIIECEGGEKYRYDKLISTIPLPEIVKLIKQKQMHNLLKSLEYVSVYNLNLGLNKEHDHDKHWVYFPEKRYPFYRIGFMSNINKNMVPEGCGSIYTEISYSNHKPLTPNIEKNIIKSLIKLKLLREKNIIVKKVLNIKYAYVIYNKFWKESVPQIKNYLKKNDIISIGRYGGWEYSAMENAINYGKEIMSII